MKKTEKNFFRAETGVFWSDVEMIQQMILRTQLHTLVIFTKKGAAEFSNVLRKFPVGIHKMLCLLKNVDL